MSPCWARISVCGFSGALELFQHTYRVACTTSVNETIRSLRDIERLRYYCEVNLAGLKLLTSLLEEVEQLRSELRAMR
jgi:hypothetical protein